MMVKQITTVRLSLLLSLLLFLTWSPPANGQHSVSGQWLVQLPSAANTADLIDRLEAAVLNHTNELIAAADSSRPSIRIRKVSKTLNIFKLDIQGVQGDIKTWLEKQPEVLSCQLNHTLELRNLIPNDPLFPQQWQYQNTGSGGGITGADMHAPEAWATSTGGVSAAGDTIVVAVIDAGVNKYHPDLQANLWKNRGEIPSDGIDNDQNGFKDDYEGWNVFSQNDQIQGVMTMHGTPVSGIIGAVGNNGIGVSGVNWNVKIMFVAGGNTEAEILAAYDYILQARKLYNETNGARGAFVVSVNCSWGINYGNPADAPLWCQAFDSLGNYGILSVAATTNQDVNVDVFGDLPTTCPSDFLISVTSLNQLDQKPSAAGWGSAHIDLGAHGEQVFTLTSNAYGFQSGTSFAAPHVSGAIALLYASPCPELIALTKINPAAAAAWVKNLVLENTEPLPGLQNLTLSGGKLHLGRLVAAYENQCADCPVPFALNTKIENHYAATLSWIAAQNSQQVDLRWRKAGAMWQIALNVPGADYLLDNLQPCTTYEYSVRSTCMAGIQSDWSPAVLFITTGCCELPNISPQVSAGQNEVQMLWSSYLDFPTFRIKLRPTGSSTWQVYPAIDTMLVVSNLSPCSAYEFQLQGFCVDGWISLTNTLSFETSGCGSCLDIPYCAAAAAEALAEWISSIQLNDWISNSGAGGNGYQNFSTAAPPTLSLFPQAQVSVSLTPGYWGSPYKEFFRIFIDFNLDGDFSDPDEMVFDPGFAQEGTVTGLFTTPLFYNSGLSRMRVMMKFGEHSQLPPEPCEMYDFGQVEDYCVYLDATITPTRIETDTTRNIRVYPQPARDWVKLEFHSSLTNEVAIQIFNITGAQMFSTRHAGNEIYLDTSSWPAGIYLVSGEMEGSIFHTTLIKS